MKQYHNFFLLVIAILGFPLASMAIEYDYPRESADEDSLGQMTSAVQEVLANYPVYVERSSVYTGNVAFTFSLDSSSSSSSLVQTNKGFFLGDGNPSSKLLISVGGGFIEGSSKKVIKSFPLKEGGYHVVYNESEDWQLLKGSIPNLSIERQHLSFQIREIKKDGQLEYFLVTNISAMTAY